MLLSRSTDNPLQSADQQCHHSGTDSKSGIPHGPADQPSGKPIDHFLPNATQSIATHAEIRPQQTGCIADPKLLLCKSSRYQHAVPSHDRTAI
jgi:hypothetical protein